MAGVQSNPGISLHPQHCCSCPVSFKYLLLSLLSGTWVSTEQMEAFPWSDLGGISEIWAHFFPTCCWTPLPFTAAMCFGLRLRMRSPPLLYTPLEDDDLEHHHCSWHFINGLPQLSAGVVCVADGAGRNQTRAGCSSLGRGHSSCRTKRCHWAAQPRQYL